MTHPAAVIAANDLRRRIRDRSALIQAILAPLGLALIIGMAFGRGFELEAEIALVDEDRSEISTAVLNGFSTAIPDDTPLRFRILDERDTALVRVGDDLAGVIVIPKGFGAALMGGEPTAIDVHVDRTDQILADVVEAVAEGLASQVNAARLALATALHRAENPAFEANPVSIAAEIADGAVRVPTSVTVEDVSGEWNPVAYFAPSMAIIFLFLSLGVAARSLVIDRRTGTLARMRAAPITDASIALGKSVGIFALSLTSMITVWGATTFGFGADWGDPTGVTALIVAVVLAITGFGILVIGVSRTEAQADGLANTIAFVFALLGGNFITPGNMPDALERLSMLTPNGWALDGFTELSAGEAKIADIATVLWVLVAMALVASMLGLIAARKSLSR